MKKLGIVLALSGMLSACTQVADWFGNDSDSSQHHAKSENLYKAKMSRDESITWENSYSDLFVDSAALERFIETRKMEGSVAQQMREFYWVRANQFAWFSSDGLTEQARGLWSLYNSTDQKKKGSPAESIKERMDSLLINDSAASVAIDTAVKSDPSEAGLAQAMAQNDSTRLNTELTLTAQLVQLTASNNAVVSAENMYWLVPRKKMDALQLADSLLNKQTDSALWQHNAVYTALRNNLRRYYTAATQGGWATIAPVKGLKKGGSAPVVTQLKKRLAATGDYPARDTSAIFSDTLITALHSVQQQYGFAPTGVLTDSLLAELNVPAGERLQQILINMNRALWMPPQTAAARIEVNIPSLHLYLYNDSGRTLEMPVIVGKEGTGTVAFNDKITSIVFSPYWNLPESIVQNEVKPAMDKDPAYLKKHNMEVVKGGDSLPQIRQLPGKDNALGQVKFLFPNSFDIYLHDTPNKDLFARKDRALSHGCIRVAKPDSLAFHLLKEDAGWTPEKITAAMSSGKEQTVAVAKPMPVSITYYTAVVGQQGRLGFRKDIYGYDVKTAARMFG